jgi:hypothetical protein
MWENHVFPFNGAGLGLLFGVLGVVAVAGLAGVSYKRYQKRRMNSMRFQDLFHNRDWAREANALPDAAPIPPPKSPFRSTNSMSAGQSRKSVRTDLNRPTRYFGDDHGDFAEEGRLAFDMYRDNHFIQELPAAHTTYPDDYRQSQYAPSDLTSNRESFMSEYSGHHNAL